jgi:carboxyl-terminal processing protease
MSEQKNTENKNKETSYIEPTEENSVHLWPDEQMLKKSRKKVKHLKIALITIGIAALLIGWCGGSLLPFSYLDAFRSRINGARSISGSNKIEEVLNIMENDWFFGQSIDNLDERLEDQAIKGITTNDEDTHTEYMSADEMQDFTQSINRNYVGIGVSYIQNGSTNMVQEVFKDSPAEKAGVKAGDVIHAVDGTVIDGMTSDEIKSRIQGDAGTNVSVTVIRDGQEITLDITRAAVSATTFGKKLDDGTIYLRMAQFGDGTPDEVKAYLKDLAVDDSDKLILDLRNNGGGYLTSVSAVASLFLENNQVVMTEQYASGPDQVVRTSGGLISNIHNIVILVNQNTASAAEVMTLALKQNRNDVTIVGTTTYGKGTVQVSRTFSDNSALKYTTAKWVSPDGTWVNGTGITPDIEVKLHAAMYETFAGMSEDETYQYDSVSDAVKDAQLCLDYLSYAPGRTDGYFSSATTDALKKFQNDHSLTSDGILNKTTYEALESAVVMDWNTSTVHDLQLQKAQEVLNG